MMSSRGGLLKSSAGTEALLSFSATLGLLFPVAVGISLGRSLGEVFLVWLNVVTQLELTIPIGILGTASDPEFPFAIGGTWVRIGTISFCEGKTTLLSGTRAAFSTLSCVGSRADNALTEFHLTDTTFHAAWGPVTGITKTLKALFPGMRFEAIQNKSQIYCLSRRKYSRCPSGTMKTFSGCQ